MKKLKEEMNKTLNENNSFVTVDFSGSHSELEDNSEYSFEDFAKELSDIGYEEGIDWYLGNGAEVIITNREMMNDKSVKNVISYYGGSFS